MVRYRNTHTGALVSVRDDKVLGAEWEQHDAASTVAGPSVGAAVAEPPRAGKGSGRDAWADYAAAKGVDVTDEMGRDEIVAAVDGDE